jgi:RecA-family ATPase
MTASTTLAANRSTTLASPEQSARHTRQAEQAVLGAMMLDPARAWAAIDGVIEQAHFLGADHRLIFGAMLALRERALPPDPVTVVLELDYQLEAAGGSDYIASLLDDTPSAANVTAYARLVREAFDKRKIIDLGERISARAGNGVDAAEAGALAMQEIEQINRNLGGQVKALAPEVAASWAAEQPPAMREWIVEGLIPSGRVTSLLGNGGLGKTLLALQIGLHVSLGLPIFGTPTKGGPVLGIFCEDEQTELNRRIRSACAAQQLDLAAADRFHVLSRDGQDSVLCTFERDHIRLTQFYAQLDATVAEIAPSLLILDTTADLYAGDFLSTPQVRQFLKIAIGGLCTRHGCGVLLLAHPSAAGMASGDGGGFSTAWSNSVRSRLYLRAQKTVIDEVETEPADRRMLEVRKSNYSTSGNKIPLLYQSGAFVLDLDPVEGIESKSGRVRTGRISVAAFDYLRKRSPLTCGFREIFDSLRASGDIPEGDYDERRKPLNRALRDLTAEGLIEACSTPRGSYRVSQRST